MRSAPLLLVLATSCVSQVHAVGGTPGGPALECAPGDGLCTKLVDALEVHRRNIGGWCGTPSIAAYMLLVDAGPDAIPYLVRAFDDRDTEVAELAMRATVELGDVGPVVQWCRGVHDLVRIDMCRRALPRTALL